MERSRAAAPGRRVLVIDDEPGILELAELSLASLGQWQVLTAASGAEGLARAARDQPHAILLDVMMPRMDGRATFAALRHNPATRDIPVILLTARIDPNDPLAQQVVSVIYKPFDPLRLAGQVGHCLGWAA